MELKYEDEEEEVLPEELPIIAMIDGITIYPQMPPMPHFMPPYLSLPSGRASAAVEEAMDNESRMICLFKQKTDKKKELKVEDVYEIGALINIVRFRSEDEGVWMMVQGVARVRLLELTQQQPFLKGRIEVIDEEYDEPADVNIEALMRNVLELFKKVVNLSPRLHEDFAVIASGLERAGHLADFIASITELKSEDKQIILQTIDPKERLEKLTVMLNRELDLLELGSKIQSEAQAEIDKDQRTYFLRENLKAIQKELGDAGEISTEVEEIKQQIVEAKMPQEAQKAAEKEVKRLEKMHPSSAEYTVSRTYLDWLVSLPWSKNTQDNLDIKRAQQILDEDHYDLEKVKDRILEYLAVRKLKTDMKGPILCFVGPPGVGKTSLGRSIARALERKFVRLSLGGVRDEAEIRGHRRTYIGSLPGRIIQNLRQIGSNNPVFMLDEVDKIGMDFRGDPAAALLEALDPEQNHEFSDHYLDVTFDLSKVMFITTANLLDPIPPALRDRMEVLELPGYTAAEKLMIAKQFLIPKQFREHGISEEHLCITDDAVDIIIRDYTKEAGVRNLEREIGAICRKTARRVAEGEEGTAKVTGEEVSEYLGPFKFYSEVAEVTGEVGVATALAATAAGGEILFVEATKMPGKGELTLTGQLGEVMKESAQAALSFVRSRSEKLNITQEIFVKNDFHIHVPSGAAPKDGPSAGIAIATALASLATGRSVVSLIAMTGEITLRGRVLPIGGLKEKTLAAKRAGIETIIIPKRNQKDLVEVPDEAKKGLKFIFVDNADQVLEVALK
ncbi:endopeptidase La [Candidatus Poribacteria bacterium]|nr:endopeptidase La [Candidatus Poribacteria bacterium]